MTLRRAGVRPPRSRSSIPPRDPSWHSYCCYILTCLRRRSPRSSSDPHSASGVNSTSVTAYRGSHHLIDYASTKGAIVSFTRSLAQALAKKRIRVNAVAPGPIWTPLIPASFPRKKVATFGSDVPLGRAGEPAEVAPSYVFLASADAAYMTGQVLHPNGGEIVNG